MAKNIVLCSDGTGNRDIKERGTNVFRLYEAVDIGEPAKQGVARQIAYYDDGVGSESFLPFRIVGGAFGWGFSKNIRDLYRNLAQTYQEGDRIYLFGFSRGAYTVRALSGMIQRCGVLDSGSFRTENALQEAILATWDAYKTASFEKRLPLTAGTTASDALEKRHGYKYFDPDIEFIGVWDTVGAVGLPFDGLTGILNRFFPRRFVNTKAGEKVRRACQALALDDERRTFHPVLWDESGAGEGRISQVWFAGVHANVGGGYPKQGMSLVALDWMMAEAEKAGLRFITSDRNYVREHVNVHDKLYDSRAGLAVYYRWDPRNVAGLCGKAGIARPKIHVSVFERIALDTYGYCPANIPFTVEAVGTVPPVSATKGKTAATTASFRTIEALIENGKPPEACSMLETLSKAAEDAKRSYNAFVALSALMVVLLAGKIISGGLSVTYFLCWSGAFAGVGALIYKWSTIFDKNCELLCSGFWQTRRSELRRILSIW